MPGLDERRVQPVAGEGLVVRAPGLVAVIAADPAGGADLVAEACRLAATDGPWPATAVAARLATLVAAGLHQVPAVAVLADGPDGLAAVVHGPATVTAGPTSITAPDGSVATRTIPTDAPVDLRLPLATGDATPGTELTAGTVAAAGATVAAGPPRLAVTTERAPASATAASRPTSPGPATGPAGAPPAGPVRAAPRPAEREASPAFRSVLLVGAAHDPAEQRAPLPVAGVAPPDRARGRPAGGAGPGVTGAPGAAGPPIVEGVLCDLGHLNDVAAARCRECGAPLSLADGRRHTGPRPPLGLLVFDDGATYVLDTDYVIGRAPGGDPLVVAGRARPLALDDDERTVSRVHAELRLEGWQVLLSDRGSTNGTFWWDGAAERWVRLVPSEARRLQPGDRAAIGRRVLALETRTTED